MWLSNQSTVVGIFNCEKCPLYATVYDIDYGPAFKNIEKTKYKAAVFMFVYGRHGNESGCIELMQW